MELEELKNKQCVFKVPTVLELITDVDTADCLMILMLQNAYRECVKLEGFYIHPDDTRGLKKRTKATKRLLEHYMIPSDYEAFFNAVRTGEDYAFDPKEYVL
jgi:hypothetical protein